ncbi:hypothetical protein BDD12DRAFT_801374 [Trichophaea hybrida]|nr:hypothetical protein BDD12DRAFT_801374 [Trichophaea hybrida]
MSVFSFRSTLLLQHPLLTLRASTTPYAVASAPVLHNPLHPLHLRTVTRYQKHLKQLNQYFVVPLSIHKSYCVRSRIRRRLHEACRLSLVEHGYKLDGTPVRKEEEGVQGLLGTIAFFPVYEVVSTPWDEIMGLMKEGVGRFVELAKQEGRKEVVVEEREKGGKRKGGFRIHKQGGGKYGGGEQRPRYQNQGRQQEQRTNGGGGHRGRVYPTIGKEQTPAAKGGIRHSKTRSEYRLKLSKK